MFHPLGLFKKVQCPNIHNCNLQNCIFNHEVDQQQDGPSKGQVYDPFNAGDIESRPTKRRRIETPEPGVRNAINGITDQDSTSLITQELPISPIEGSNRVTEPDVKSSAQPPSQPSRFKKTSQPQSTIRPVSPPPKRAVKPIVFETAEKLVPRPVAKAPAILKVRMSFIELLHKQMHSLKSQYNDGDDVAQRGKVSEQQVIKWVLDEEEQIATNSSNEIYRNAMSHKVLYWKKMKPEDWHRFVEGKINPGQINEPRSDETAPGLSSNEEVQILKYVRTNLAGLDIHGYVTKAPSTVEIQKAKDAVKAAVGYELCDRCGTRFQVFPGRDEQGRLTTQGACHYHWGKLGRGQRQKTDHVTGQAQAAFPCCGQLPGSEGCTQAATHVFKVTDTKRIAALLQFEQTPVTHDSRQRTPMAFDCEMAYTTYGMELVRVTAVSWPNNTELLDVLVRPYGEILDLNTRFSGVSQEQYANALAYDSDDCHKSENSEDKKLDFRPLRKVASPAIARQLMFDLLSPETPLIGHAIDNDLNACRMIHHFVIDTVLLFPHPRGLPFRYGLKMLATQYLRRSIQTGGDAGHDSKEDSIATGDLVRVKVAEKWQMMRLQGWKFQGGNLLPPGR